MAGDPEDPVSLEQAIKRKYCMQGHGGGDDDKDQVAAAASGKRMNEIALCYRPGEPYRGVGAGGARGASAPPLFLQGVHCTPTNFPPPERAFSVLKIYL